MNDLELLRRWRLGDDAAGEIFFNAHLPTVYRFFSNKIARDDVEDFVHQTFELCFAEAARRDEVVSVRAYLLGIARNILLMHLRRLGRARNIFDDFGTVSAAAVSGRAHTAVAHQQEQQLLLGALRQIPVELQVALELFYWEELSLVEVAAICDIAVGTVKSRLARAKATLRGVMAQAQVPADLARRTAENLDAWAAGLRNHIHAGVQTAS